MFDGVMQKLALPAEGFSTITFERFAFDLSEFVPTGEKRRRKPSEYFLLEALTPTAEDLNGPWRKGQYLAAAHEKIVTPLLTMVLPLVALGSILAAQNGAIDMTLARYVALRYFFAFFRVLLIATTLVFISELVVSRAAGVSALKMVFVPVSIAIALGILATTVFNPIVATATRQYDLLEDEITNSDRSVLSISEDGLWLRQVVGDRQSVIQARRSSPEGAVLFDVEFHVFDQSGTLSERIVAASAELEDKNWKLKDVRRWKVDANDIDIVGPMVLKENDVMETDLTVEQILNSFAPPQTVPFWELPRFIERLEVSGFSATRHRQYYQSAMAAPALFTAMVLIGAGFTMRHARFGKIGIMVLLTVLAGFALYSFNNVAASLGAAGTVPVILAAWAPSGAAVLLVLGLLLHLEDG